ncbi:MAG: hypothetical protein HUU38_02595 [Anaerolineales bacterium]|nr:hypothetical protein [Anaerolineales bacterium]
MSNNITLEIEESFRIHGRGLMVIPKTFLFVTPETHVKPFVAFIALKQTDGMMKEIQAEFLIEHFSLTSKSGGLAGRYSLVLLLPEQTESSLLSSNDCIQVSESTLSMMKSMIHDTQPE